MILYMIIIMCIILIIYYVSLLCTDSPSSGGVSNSSTPAVGPIVGGIFNDEIDHSQLTRCILSL